MADYAFYLRLPHLSSKRQYLLKDGKIVVTSEKKVSDYAALLKYDWHLYHLQKDILSARSNKDFKQYLTMAKIIFANDVEESKPNKKANMFGNHSVFYHLYGHTRDCLHYADKNVVCVRDCLTVISGNNLVNTLSIIRHSKYFQDAVKELSNAYGIQPVSAEMIVQMRPSQLTGLRENQVAEHISYAETFLQRVTELAKYDK